MLESSNAIGKRRVNARFGWSAGWWTALALTPAVVFLTLFMVIPLLLMFTQSLHPTKLIGEGSRSIGLANYLYLAQRSVYVEAFVRTFHLALYAVVGAVLLGYPTALVLRQLHERAGSTLVLGLTFPILAGPLVVVLGWMLLLPKTGPVNHILVSLGVVSSPIQLIGTETAVVIALVQFSLSFVVLNILNSLLRIDPTLTEAASSLGANPLRTFWHITWPLSLPGVLAGAIIAFGLAVSAFVAPQYLGGDTLLVATTLIGQFILTRLNWELASATGLVLVIISIGAIFVFNKVVVGIVEKNLNVNQ